MFQRAVAWDMLKVYGSFVDTQEKRRSVLYVLLKLCKGVMLFIPSIWLNSVKKYLKNAVARDF